MKRDDLLNSKEYWLSKIQIDLFNEVNHFMEEKGLNRTQLAERLGVSKGYVSQIMNGDSDHRLSKLVELSLAIGLVPRLSFEQLEKNWNNLEVEKMDARN
jgi:transcriptional regulator with XRE-family HTH domain